MEYLEFKEEFEKVKNYRNKRKTLLEKNTSMCPVCKKVTPCTELVDNSKVCECLECRTSKKWAKEDVSNVGEIELMLILNERLAELSQRQRKELQSNIEILMKKATNLC